MAQNLTLEKEIQDIPETLAEEVNDPMVIRAAQHLIARHRAGQGFDIDAFDVPHQALADISAQLEEAGMSHAMAEPLIAALRRYVMANGGSFVRAANAKPVVIRLTVAGGMPDRRFDAGMTELACIGAKQVKVEGAAAVNVRATPSGTATTSNAADVDAMFANVKGLNLWIRFEAPTKEELAGLMNSVESALAGVAQSVGGAMGAGDFKKLLETLQKEGALTPAVIALVNNLIALQEGLKQGGQNLAHADVAALVKSIAAQIADGQAQGLLPPALITAVMQSMTDLAAHGAVAAFLTENGVTLPVADNDNLSVDQRLETLMEKIEALQNTEGVDPALKAQLMQMVADIAKQMTEGVPPAQIVNALGIQLTELAARDTLPAAVFDAIGDMMPDIASLKESLQAGATSLDLSQGEAMLKMLEDIAAQVQDGKVELKNLPPELQALIEQMGGVETIAQEKGREARVEALAQAVAAQGDPQLSETVQAAVLALASPQALAALPAEVVQTIQTFISDNPAIVETAATQTVIRQMGAVLATLDPASAEAVDMKNAIEMLRADGLQTLMNKETQGLLPPGARQVLQNFAADHPAAMEIVVTQAVLRDMGAALEGIDPASPQAAELRQIMDMVRADGVSVLAHPDVQNKFSPEAVKLVTQIANGPSHAAREGVAPLTAAAVDRAVEKGGLDNFVASGGMDRLPPEDKAAFIASIPVAERSGYNFTAPPAAIVVSQIRNDLGRMDFTPPALPKGQMASAQDKAMAQTAQRLQANLAKLENRAGTLTAATAAEIVRDVRALKDGTKDQVKLEQLKKIESRIEKSVADPKNLEREVAKTHGPCGHESCDCFGKVAPKDKTELDNRNRQLEGIAKGMGDNAAIKQHQDGSITIRGSDGQEQHISAQQMVREAAKVADAQRKLSAVETKFVSIGDIAKSLKDRFHECGPNCNHGGVSPVSSANFTQHTKRIESDTKFSDVSAHALASSQVSRQIDADFAGYEIDFAKLNMVLGMK